MCCKLDMRAWRNPCARLCAAQVGCGADELIDLLMRCVLDPGDAIVDCPPTFTMYVFDADVNDARVVTVPRLDGFRLDVEGELSHGLVDQSSRISDVCSKRVLHCYDHAGHQPAKPDPVFAMSRHKAGRAAVEAEGPLPDVAQQSGRQHDHGGRAAGAVEAAGAMFVAWL